MYILGKMRGEKSMWNLTEVSSKAVRGGLDARRYLSDVTSSLNRARAGIVF